MAFSPISAKGSPQLLKQSQILSALLCEAQRLKHLQRLLDSQLQPAARPFCRIAAWRNGRLSLIVSDGHWATRLRYQQRRLQRQLQTFDEFAGLTNIVIKVRPQQNGPSKNEPSPSLSKQAAVTINEAAQSIIDPRLRSALERLASRSEND